MHVRPSIIIAAGAVLTAAIAVFGARGKDVALANGLDRAAVAKIAEIDGEPVRARFSNPIGLPTRHPLLTGGEGLDEATRDRVAKAVAALPGVGGISWSDGTMTASASVAQLSPLHCQEDVQSLLRARTIRFEESSSAIMASSGELIDEVAAALRPCLGSKIAITGHTDATGTEAANMVLSRERALAVRNALMDRGIPANGMQARGVGSTRPVDGLVPEDPANRRIEFQVVTTQRLLPTPIDTPGPR